MHSFEVMICTLDQRLPSLVTGTWGANTSPCINDSQTLVFKIRKPSTFFHFGFFRCFPRINVGGDSMHFPSLEDAPSSPVSCPSRRAGCDTFLYIFRTIKVYCHAETIKVIYFLYIFKTIKVLCLAETIKVICFFTL